MFVLITLGAVYLMVCGILELIGLTIVTRELNFFEKIGYIYCRMVCMGGKAGFLEKAG